MRTTNTEQESYNEGYAAGRLDSNEHNGKQEVSDGDAYSAGYKDGFGHKAKQVR